VKSQDCFGAINPDENLLEGEKGKMGEKKEGHSDCPIGKKGRTAVAECDVDIQQRESSGRALRERGGEMGGAITIKILREGIKP